MKTDTMDMAAMLAEPVERLLSKGVDRALLMAVEAGQPATALWQALEALGVTQALVPEVQGGAGLGWTDVLPMLRLLGQHAAPVPLGETLLGAHALARAGLAVPEGPLAVAGARFELDAHGRVSGCDEHVVWAGQADTVVAAAWRGCACFVVALPRASLQIQPVHSHARLPGGTVVADGTQPSACAPAPWLAAPERDGLGLLPELALVRAAQISGSLDAVLAQTVEYANTRTQFGKPIGKFQAIQHHLADLAMQVAAAQVAVQFGARALDSGAAAQAVRGAAVAKQRASRAATTVAAVAHQVFGAIGVTDEHLLHCHTRRLWQWRAEAGSDHYWAEWLGRQALRAGGAGLWQRLVGETA